MQQDNASTRLHNTALSFLSTKSEQQVRSFARKHIHTNTHHRFILLLLLIHITTQITHNTNPISDQQNYPHHKPRFECAKRNKSTPAAMPRLRTFPRAKFPKQKRDTETSNQCSCERMIKVFRVNHKCSGCVGTGGLVGPAVKWR